MVIADFLGLKLGLDNSIEVNALVPETWDWFCLDKVNYRGRELTVIWDRTGKKYQKGKGLMPYIDGELKAKALHIEQLKYSL